MKIAYLLLHVAALVSAASLGLCGLFIAGEAAAGLNRQDPKESTQLIGHSGKVFCLAFSPDGTLLASGGSDGVLILWDMKKREAINTSKMHDAPNYCLAFNNAGAILAIGTIGHIKLFNIQTQKVDSKIASNIPNCLAFSPDGSKMAAGLHEVVRLWDMPRANNTSTLAGHIGPVYSVAFSKDGRWLASGGLDGHIMLWDIKTQRNVASLPDTPQKWNEGMILALAFSDDSSLVAAGYSKSAVKVWDIKTAKEKLELDGHSKEAGTRGVLAVCFRGNDLLASCGRDGTIKLWDIGSGKETSALKGHTGFVRALSFSPDGTLLASGGDDGKIRLWSIPAPTKPSK